MKKRLFFAVLVGVLALGVLGGTVLAQEDGTDGDSSQQEQPKTLLQRVAAILGIDEAQIEDAFKQAARETETSCFSVS